MQSTNHPKPTRAERAAEIVNAQGVTVRNIQDRTFDVQSQADEAKQYRVNLKRCTCECKDFERRPEFACKHILAAQQYEQAERTARDTAPLAPRRTYAELFAQIAAPRRDLFAVEHQL